MRTLDPGYSESHGTDMPESPIKPESPPTPQILPFTVTSAMARADQALLGTPRGEFSEKAFHELNDAVKAYIADIIASSAAMARRQGVDSISAAHVEHAVREATPVRTRRLPRIMGLVGALALGAFVPEVGDAIVDGTGLSLVWVFFGLLGIALMVYEQTKN
jgi:hypothetical protein